MPGAADMNVKIGADISDLLSKVDRAKARLNQLTEENGLLKTELKDLNQSLKNNDSAIARLNSQIAKSTAITKEDRAAVAALRKERDALVASGTKISAAIKQTSSDLATNTTQLKAQTVELKKAESAGNGFVKGTSNIYGGLRKLAYLIPGVGIAGLVSLIAGPLVDAFTDWFEAIDNVSDAQKRLKANLQTYNEINEEANKNAGKQIASLRILYQAATDVNLSMKERLAAVKGLQDQFPDYFKNINKETILNGGAKSAYDALADSIIRTARAKAAIGKLEDIAAKQLDADIQKQKILNATTNEMARAQDRVLKSQTSGSSLTGGGAGGQTVTITRAEQIKVIEARRDAALKLVEINRKSLQDQADFITKFISLSDLAKAVETDIKVPKVKDKKNTKDVETIADVLAKLALQIDFLNQKEILLKTSQADNKVKAISGTVDTLMSKFRLLADNPIVLNLEARINDIQLTEQFKGVLKGNKNEKLEVPVELKPEIEPNFTFFDTDRYNLTEQLKRLGVTKTKIGIPIETANIKELQDTLAETQLRFENMAKLTTDVLSPAFDNLFEGILSGSQNAFQSFGQVLEQTIVKLGATILKAAALAAIISLINPFASGVPGKSGFGSIFQKLLGFAEGGLVKGYSTGGPVWGAGSATSDSIPARLSRGEYVIKAAKVAEFGVDFFNKINFGGASIKDILKDKFGLMGFAGGGYVSPNSVNLSRPALVPAINIGGGQQIFIAESKLRGQDIVTSFKRASATISRNS